jgi:UDP-4-amino-4,6-dideoxy-N-acetyl-beta-L-altrosamine N-acetyltransferase
VLRVATENDVETIRRWRNHPKTRDASIFTTEITPEMHRDWWTNRSADPTYHILIFSYRDRPCGVVLFQDHDADARTSEWGFFLDVDGLTERNELLPAWMELEKDAVAYGFEELKLTSMGGRTLAWNASVLALHKRFGFQQVPEKGYTTEIDGKEQAVVWTELRRP